MGVKKNLPKVFIGSVYPNYWQHVIKSELFFNKKDPYALVYKKQFERRVIGKSKQKNLHPNFDFSIKEIKGLDNHSYVQHTWITNMVQKFYLHESKYSINHMNEEIKICNTICDYQRQFEGHDDELEDEDKQLY